MTRLPECQEHESASWHFFCGFSVNLIKKSLTTRFGLKELEHIERICENVGNINLNGNGDVLSQLMGLMHPGTVS